MSCQPAILLSLLALEFTSKMLSAIFSPFFGEFVAIFGFHVTILLRISVLWGENIAYFRRFSRAGFCRSFRGPGAFIYTATHNLKSKKFENQRCWQAQAER
ncbi:hypothetical protein C8R42DRAFT_182111 [Lentinula raphanica]|nr:hypothetical protein C8R42DRAFT_182111 [Lentinula raphanica]